MNRTINNSTDTKRFFGMSHTVDIWVHFKGTLLVKFTSWKYIRLHQNFSFILFSTFYTIWYGKVLFGRGWDSPLKFLSTVKGWRVSCGDAPDPAEECSSWRTCRTRICQSRRSSSSRSCRILNGQFRQSSSC